ncbi:family 20 glycosylhydrolase [Maribacter sp.]|uniref:family 20 glycosylhydrolase n=1 Tax=Maribacter sp. TaxID=1897614 RepID=UPI0025BA7EB9|nr:family 20 glycosylhydrolase [Maribacter sp.]
MLFFNHSYSQSVIDLEEKYPIIPTAQEIKYDESEVVFKDINIIKSDFIDETNKLRRFFQKNGIKQSSKGLKIQIIKKNIPVHNANEAYKLIIDAEIKIWAETEKGAYYAIKTLQQIFRKEDKKGVFPKLKMTDWPAFKIRGFMHDTGRNFQSIPQLKDQIEVLSQYKYNVFHWHLTDDPGWRLESKLYPQLQSRVATFRGKGKFYTQEDFKDILAFCKARHITVIPEFDIPGHSKAFRSAMAFKSMKDEKALSVLLDLFNELCSLASAEEMPYIHIGTDEVRNKEEYVSKDFIQEIMNLVKKNNRELIVWKEGIEVKEDTMSINQLWAQHEPREGHRFIDSRANYINHLDPFAGMVRLFFQQPCRQAKSDSLALGGVLCAWPDNNVAMERDILKQNPIYSSIVFYADAIWKGRKKNYLQYWAKLPTSEKKEFKAFQNFEKKVITHRDLFFKGKEFPYVKQTNIMWNVIGPFNHKGDVLKKFPVEDILKESYHVNGKEYKWSKPRAGGTFYFKHFFDFPTLTKEKTGTFYAYSEIYSPTNQKQDFWIGFQGWSRSGGRRGGPFPNQGQWHTTNPKIWVNDTQIAPPVWKQPNLGSKTDEIPFIDEDYFYRTPTKVNLKKGWNKVLLKIPHGGNSWKWTFTCVPVSVKKEQVSEVNELKFRTVFNQTSKVSINSFPKNYQLYSRDANNKATIKISGIADQSVDSLIVKVHRDKGIVTRTTIATQNQFSIFIEIEAIKHNYKIELFSKLNDGEEMLIKSATHVTAGDVYVINGQSNAWAMDYDNVYNDEDVFSDFQWVRTIGAMHVYNKPAIYPEAKNIDWYMASGKAPDIRGGAQLVGNGMVGVLGMNIGINLVASEGVPVAIINGAGGGGSISFYQKTKEQDLDTPYGRLQYRLIASGLKNKIKAFIWNQGENNAGTAILDYKKALNKLYKNFKSDYTFEKFYIIQTPPGCNSISGHQSIREAQRQFTEENENIRILTRHGFSENPKKTNGNYFLPDGCHYHAHGYEVLANWISNLASFDFYGGKLDYEAPKLIKVVLESPSSLIIEFNKEVVIQPNLIVGGITYSVKHNQFAINNRRTSSISSVEVIAENLKKVRLIFSGQNISVGDSLTYVLNDTYPESIITFIGPWIVDAITGVGAVGFTIPIVKKEGIP